MVEPKRYFCRHNVLRRKFSLLNLPVLTGSISCTDTVWWVTHVILNHSWILELFKKHLDALATPHQVQMLWLGSICSKLPDDPRVHQGWEPTRWVCSSEHFEAPCIEIACTEWFAQAFRSIFGFYLTSEGKCNWDHCLFSVCPSHRGERHHKPT